MVMHELLLPATISRQNFPRLHPNSISFHQLGQFRITHTFKPPCESCILAHIPMRRSKNDNTLVLVALPVRACQDDRECRYFRKHIILVIFIRIFEISDRLERLNLYLNMQISWNNMGQPMPIELRQRRSNQTSDLRHEPLCDTNTSIGQKTGLRVRFWNNKYVVYKWLDDQNFEL